MHVWLPAITANSGADVYTSRLAAGLIERDIDARISWFPHGIEIFPQLMRLAACPDNIDIIHANSWNGFACGRKNRKLVITVHHCISDPAYQPYKSFPQKIYHQYFVDRYEGRSIQSADHVIAVSQYTADTAQELFNINNVNVIHNGIDTDLFSPGLSQKHGARFRLLFVGNASRRKGFDLLQPVMEILGNDFELFYTGQENKTFRNQGNTFAIGRLEGDALVQAYRDCDAFLFPSRLEGFGYSVCEAMACGKPVIASNNSSLSEIVRDGKTGILCKTDDVQAFCHAARHLSENRAIADSMGKTARQHVLDNFSLDKMIDSYIALYNNILTD